ncbi:hydroxylamine reductase [Methylocaldum szegediense]|uniref:Hydroxylamine reductase n=1 Tax=Methylocaldum szegediense TaxID=73780 RepID=A0ABM9I880_9GAMM|nr:hydroxylamine reductase [Methylocaldum szegediense]CAI8954917.1 protein S-nitrosylase [Methylocaldum szegediense]
MFCYQCEQTARTDTSNGCTSTKGICGKDQVTADLQDLLIYGLKGIAQYARRARAFGISDREVDGFILYAMFTTLTNVNFNPARFIAMIQETARLRDRIKARYEEAARERGGAPEVLNGPAAWQPMDDIDGLLAQTKSAAVTAGREQVGDDIIGLRAMILYGLKGVAAYAYHARILGYESDELYTRFEEILDFLAGNPADAETLLDQALAVGQLNLTALELLDAANTGSFGHPEPTAVRTTPVKGKAILVSGHDLKDLAALLEQTKGRGINVYTHGELLPAHGYPKLRAYPHLVGNYGGAWQDQTHEFAEFPGAILMTSNCLIEPHPRYRSRLFTTGPVGWPGVRHIANGDFSPVIQAALALPGFQEDGPEQTVTVGFARNAVLGVADKVVDAVKTGAIRHFFLIGGCDGAAPGRNYYTDLANRVPEDSVVLTLGCGKYRFNRNEFGTIGGIPRLLDLGQCNDAYSAIQIASALAQAFNCGVNDLPLSLMVSWFEQKAVAVLLTLLSLGIRGIRLGPSLPAFLTPALLEQLSARFDLKPITTAEADIEAALQRAA